MAESRTHEQRRATALDVYRTWRGDAADAERETAGLERRFGALGSFAIDYVFGDIWSRPQLSRRDRSLLVLSALTCIGAEPELALHVEGALNHGLTREEIDEIMLQVSAYAGYPRALAGQRVVDAVFRRIDGVERLAPRPPAQYRDDDERRASGVDTYLKMQDGPMDVDVMEGRVPRVGRYTLDYLYGEIWSRPQLALRDRSLVVLAVLVTMGRVGELKLHVPGGLRNGLTRDEIMETILHLTIYAGWPPCRDASIVTDEIFQSLDAANDDDD